MVKIIFLGSAGSSNVLARGGYSAGGLVLQFDGVQFHMDPGPGALFSALQAGINPKQTTVFLASTSDLIKTHDLSLLIDTMTYSGIERRGLLVAASSVVNGNDESDASLRLLQRDRLDKLVVLKPGNKVGISLCEVHPVRVDSNDNDALGYKLFFPKFLLGYIGKTLLTKELLEDLEGCDMLIFDLPSNVREDENMKSLSLEDAKQLLLSVKPKMAILNGFDLGALKYDPIIMCRELSEATGVQCIASKKGLMLNSNALLSHSPVRGFK